MKTTMLTELAIVACPIAAAITLLVARAAEDCNYSHPQGCTHTTTVGDELCGGYQITDCDGAGSAGCATTNGRHVERLPTETPDSSSVKDCVQGSVTNNFDSWDGHHYIEKASQHCTYTFHCKWNQELDKCKVDDTTISGWTSLDYSTSKSCGGSYTL